MIINVSNLRIPNIVALREIATIINGEQIIKGKSANQTKYAKMVNVRKPPVQTVRSAMAIVLILMLILKIVVHVEINVK